MKILIADDHWVVRESLKQVMKRVHQAFKPLEAENFADALALLRQHSDIDLMLIDLIMPGFDQFDGLKRLRSEFPDVPVVIISVHEDLDYVLKSISHGVIGYIPKSAGGKEIERAIERVLAGEVSFPRRILEQSAAAPQAPVESPAAASAADKGMALLTNRERDVLDLLGRGYSVTRIAASLTLSSHTVRVHIGNLMKKLGFKDRSAAIHYAVSLANEAKRQPSS
ncbi:MAG: response regulator [Parvibaculaceae bacterium]